MTEKEKRKMDEANNAVIKLFVIYFAGLIGIFVFFTGIVAFLSWLLWTAVVVAGAVIKDHIEDIKTENHRLAKALYEAQKPWWEERRKMLFDKEDNDGKA